MRTQEEIIKQLPVYLHNWDTKQDVANDFRVGLDADINILFASYGTDNYSGDAWVLFESGGDLYETSGGHCSCYGLEDQWSPTSVLLEELETRIRNGMGLDDWSGNNYHSELRKFLDVDMPD